MKKSKLNLGNTFNNIKKKGIAATLTALLCFAGLSAEGMKKEDLKKLQNANVTSYGKKSEITVKKYAEENKSWELFKELTSSDIYNLTSKAISESDVRKAIGNIYLEKIPDTKNLATLYAKKSKQTAKDTNMTLKEVNDTAKTYNSVYIENVTEKDIQVFRCAIQRYFEMFLNTLNLTRVGATSAEIFNYDDIDGENEFMCFVSEEERDSRKEQGSVLNRGIDYINEFMRFEEEAHGRDGKKVNKKFNTDLSKAKKLVSKHNLNEKDYENIDLVIFDMTELMANSPEMFGEEAMFRGIAQEIVYQLAIDYCLNNLEKLGYNIKNLGAEDFKSNQDNVVDKKQTHDMKQDNETEESNEQLSKYYLSGNLNFAVQNGDNSPLQGSDIGPKVEFGVILPWKNNNGSTYLGGEWDGIYALNGSKENSNQFLLNAGINKLTKRNNTFSTGVKVGLDSVNIKNMSFVIGAKAIYAWNINDKNSVFLGGNISWNIKKYGKVGISGGYILHLKGIDLIFSLSAEYTFNMNRPDVIISYPDETPEVSGYDKDNGTENEKEQTTQKGDMNDDKENDTDSTTQDDMNNPKVKPVTRSY